MQLGDAKSFISYSSSEGVLQFTPSVSDVGTYTITGVITDNSSGPENIDMTVQVTSSETLSSATKTDEEDSEVVENEPEESQLISKDVDENDSQSQDDKTPEPESKVIVTVSDKELEVAVSELSSGEGYISEVFNDNKIEDLSTEQ